MDRLRLAWLGHAAADAGDGLTRYSRETVAGLRRRGCEVVVFHHSADSGNGVALPAVSLGNRLRLATTASERRLERWLQEGDFDLVHLSLAFSTLDFRLPRLCERLRLPIVATVHFPFDHRPTLWGGLSRTLYRLYSGVFSRLDAVIVFGEPQRRLLRAVGVPPGRVHVVPNGVDVERWKPGPMRVGGQEQEMVFSYAGRIDREKNVGHLLQAFCSLPSTERARLLLAGDGSDRRRLQASSRQDPRVEWLGPVGPARLNELLQSSDAFFLPSSIEGLSLALLEAMACGVCPVATDVGCDGEVVRGAGIVLDPEHLDAQLSLAMRLLLAIPSMAHELGRQARARVVERYSLERNLDALVETYGALCASRSSLSA